MSTGYAEPARTYRWLLATAGVLLAAFAFDCVLGGGIAHLPGWVLAFVLVVGIHAFVIYAARSTHSLLLDDETLSVGEESVPRADIVGFARGVDPELPVLGWRTGLPRGAKGIVIRLVDEQKVVVPSRHPQQLEAALGVAALRAEDETAIRPASADDLDVVPDIDERAEAVFRVAGYDLPVIAFDDDALAAAEAIFVAGSPAVGFAWVDEVDGLAHLVEIAVLPGSMRRGLGTRLLERACDWAREAGYPAMTLTTYADVAWNGPWYRACGFVEVTAPTPGLVAIREHEAELGLDAVGRRVVLRRELG